MEPLKELEINNVKYKVEEKSSEVFFHIINPDKPSVPEQLSKYYDLNDYSIDALTKGYLYAAHPLELNDEYDCSKFLIDYSNATLDDFYVFLLEKFPGHKYEDKNQIKEKYNTEKGRWDIIKLVREIRYNGLYSKYGIISLSENPANILMWSHYSRNKGFLLTFDTKKLPLSFFGPFPINYNKSLKFEKLDLKKYDNYLRFLYETNIKSDIWELEDEWRYITYNSLGQYHPKYLKEDSDSRKFKYEINAIAGILLGPEFFNVNEVIFDETSKENGSFNIKTGNSEKTFLQKKKLLDFIIDSNILAYRIVLNEEWYEFGIEPIKIKKISDQEYKLNFSGTFLTHNKNLLK